MFLAVGSTMREEGIQTSTSNSGPSDTLWDLLRNWRKKKRTKKKRSVIAFNGVMWDGQGCVFLPFCRGFLWKWRASLSGKPDVDVFHFFSCSFFFLSFFAGYFDNYYLRFLYDIEARRSRTDTFHSKLVHRHLILPR